MQKEEQQLQKRFIELSRLAYSRNIVTYTDFLNMNELNILHTLPKDQLYTQYETYGGYELAERQMVAFLPDALYSELDYPYHVYRILPLNRRYAEELSHRDYLGAILNLGIERCKTGDILVTKDDAVIFLQETLGDFVKSELTRIRHTQIQVTEEHQKEFHYTPKYEEIKGTVASIRLDSLLSLAYNTSRSKMVELIEGARVSVNGKLITTNSYQIKEKDVISVRGKGRFRFEEIISHTKKDRIYISIYKYS